MFSIISVTTATGNSSSVLVGGPGGVIGAHGRLGGNYALVFPTGYIKITDAGNSVSGPGGWSLNFGGASTNWFYDGDGQAKIAVDASGTFTVSGGANTITGKVTSF